MSHLNELNDRQRAGVEAAHGPVLVIAGAGSGKTKMLTARIVELMGKHQVPAHNILAVTFTNKAAGEMRERVSRALGLHPDALTPPPPWVRGSAHLSQPAIGTFHAICTRLLRREIDRTPYKQQFVIYDDSDQLSLVKDCFSQLNLSDKTFSPKSFQHGINQAKCSAFEPHELEQNEFNLYQKNLRKVYELYQKELFKNNAIDFGEIITLTYRLLRDNADILEKYQDLYRFIHVDEYQDTNRAQYLLVKLLAAKHRNICVVGDEDQSIYKWRGADIRNILDFEKDYPEAQVIKLEQNYRSTQTIINASSKVISHNSSRKAKTLWTSNEVGELVSRYQLADDRAEAELVVSQLKAQCASNGYAFSDVSIFYRTNAQSRVLEEVLRRDKIPYKIVGGLKFYDRKEIKDVLAYFRILTNGNDGVSFKRIINVPQRSIGKATVEKVEEHANKTGVTFEKALEECGGNDVLAGAARRKTGEFLNLLHELRALMRMKSLSEFYHELLDRTRYVDELNAENTEESLSRIENLKEFDSNIVEFENAQKIDAANAGHTGDVASAETLLPLFLESVTLSAEQQSGENEAGSVSLMTLHTSKGLEFPLVFMVGNEERLFPSIRSEEESDEDIEEERRLCYVGMTRAKRKLYMTHAVCRRVYGEIVYHDPSRFFDEIPKELVEYTDLARRAAGVGGSYGRKDDEGYDYEARSAHDAYTEGPSYSRGTGVHSKQPARRDSSWDAYVPSTVSRPSTSGDRDSMRVPTIGIKVKHGTYGLGIVRGVEGATQDAKVTVEFSGKVMKKFVLKFANLEYMG
ncbi:MAG: UvrD-helicase domain-containing protein [Deltaproteobacteria bacterium]|nr:UvrD-helicase domain-containing protein [Deltaproteobacteria bacterium]